MSYVPRDILQTTVVCQDCYSVVQENDTEFHDQAVHNYDTTTVMSRAGEIVMELREPKKWDAPIVEVAKDKCYHPEANQ